MKPKVLDSLIRIKMSKDTFQTFPMDKAAEIYTRKNQPCDFKVKRGQRRRRYRPRPTPRPTSNNDETCQSYRTELDLVEPNFMDTRSPSTTLIQRPRTKRDCFLIINKQNGLVLSAYQDEVLLWTWDHRDNYDYQLWFWEGEADDVGIDGARLGQQLVSYKYQKPLEAGLINEEKVKLSFSDTLNKRQRWIQVGDLPSLSFELKTVHRNLKLDVLDKITENGSIVGSSRTTKSITQKWIIEKVFIYNN